MGTITISYKGDDGTAEMVSYDENTKMATAGERVSPYTWNAAEGKIRITTPGGEICITFEEANAEPAVGDTTRYTMNTGAAGTATITAIA